MKDKYRLNKVILNNFDISFFESSVHRDTRVIEMVSTIKRFISPNHLHKTPFGVPYQEETTKLFDMTFVDIIVRFKIEKNIASFGIVNKDKIPSDVIKSFISIPYYLIQNPDIPNSTIQRFKLTSIELEQLHIIKSYLKILFSNTPIEFLNVIKALSDVIPREQLINNIGLIKMLIYKSKIIGYYCYSVTEEDNKASAVKMFKTMDNIKDVLNCNKEHLKDSLRELSTINNKVFNEVQFEELLKITEEVFSVNLIDDINNTYKVFEDRLLDVYNRFTDDLVSSFTIAVRESLVKVTDISGYKKFRKEQERIIK